MLYRWILKMYFVFSNPQKYGLKFYLKIKFLKIYLGLKFRRCSIRKIYKTGGSLIEVRKNGFKKKILEIYEIGSYFLGKTIDICGKKVLKILDFQKYLNMAIFWFSLILTCHFSIKTKRSKIGEIKYIIDEDIIKSKRKKKIIRKIGITYKPNINKIRIESKSCLPIKEKALKNRNKSIYHHKDFYGDLNQENMKNVHLIYSMVVKMISKIGIIINMKIKTKNNYEFVYIRSFFLCHLDAQISISFLNFSFKTFSLFIDKMVEKLLTRELRLCLSNLLNINGKFIQISGVKYLKLELIGKGGSCKVYKIVNENKKIFALKRTKLLNFGVECLHNCINEISILRVLKNRNRIIQLESADISFSNGILYLVFEYGDCDLEKFIKNNLNCPSKIKLLRSLWKQMLEAVHTIHEERIVHGDIKPSNFLLVNNSLKIIDFGISKPIQKNTTNITRDVQIGTINYMSPEAILYIPCLGYNKKKFKLNRSSDIWSLGCILFQMVYGNSPFFHLPMMKKIQAIVCKSFEILFLPINIPTLKDVLKNCLMKNPTLRPSIPELILHPFLFKQDSTIHSFMRSK
nr:spindle checkpoint protein kinase [Cryptomonas sp.]